jgi:2-succinyl-6-hydroxy-2,4-cyclohexadiene-1-carboxylate synthase
VASPHHPGRDDRPPIHDVEAGGSALAYEVHGEGPTLVLAHGFTLNARAWGPFGSGLARTHRVVAVDLPGHGASSQVVASFSEAARLLGEVGGRGDYLGYSMGGRVCLRLALDDPERVARLVLVGAGAGIEDAQARTRRRLADEALATGLEQGAASGTRALDDFLAEWLGGPLFATLDPRRAELPARRLNTAAGLASSLRTCGAGSQAPLWKRLAELSMPVLVMVGALDERYAPTARRMAEAIGSNAELALVPEAGHACHLEQPDVCARLVEEFVADREP